MGYFIVTLLSFIIGNLLGVFLIYSEVKRTPGGKEVLEIMKENMND